MIGGLLESPNATASDPIAGNGGFAGQTPTWWNRGYLISVPSDLSGTLLFLLFYLVRDSIRAAQIS